MGQGARIEKRDENAYNGYREIAKLIPGDSENPAHHVVNELREIIERGGEIKEIAEEDEELLKKLE